MKHVCPYCKRPMTGDMAMPPMRPRWQRIYKATLEAGPSGIHPEDLLVRMYGDNEWPTPGGPTVLRVCIHGINRMIASYGQRIVGSPRKNYRLTSTKKDELDETQKEVQSEADH